jgi:7-cyano-7-deazaguanine reductase
MFLLFYLEEQDVMSHSDVDGHEQYGELGQPTSYDRAYNPKHLFAILRAPKWQELGLDASALPFVGFDIWNHYEVSWLNDQGRPCVAIARITYDCASAFLIESKSLKLYFNSLNQTCFSSVLELKACITKDLSACVQADVLVTIFPSHQWDRREAQPHFSGMLVDNLDVSCSMYEVDSTLLQVGNEIVEEALCSDLLRSNCPVTNQPDWGSVYVRYEGRRLLPESFLKYVVSFRNHQGFHEQCIEQMFVDILRVCKPKHLTVYGRYTRRGGLDINPYRSTDVFQGDLDALHMGLMRQ